MIYNHRGGYSRRKTLHHYMENSCTTVCEKVKQYILSRTNLHSNVRNVQTPTSISIFINSRYNVNWTVVQKSNYKTCVLIKKNKQSKPKKLTLLTAKQLIYPIFNTCISIQIMPLNFNGWLSFRANTSSCH